MKTRFRVFAAALLLLPALIVLARQNKPVARPMAPPRPPVTQSVPLSLLNRVGELAHPVAAREVADWRRALHTGQAKGYEAAKRHLWLGEWEQTKNESPLQATWHFE